MKEYFRCAVCEELIADDEGITTLNGEWVCDNNNCRSLDDENQATEVLYITINCLSEIQNNPADDNLTDIILDVDVSEEYYNRHGYSKEEYPEDGWTIWVTQNDYDRKEKAVWVSLCNEGLAIDDWIKGIEKEKILQYVKDNGLDITAGLLLE